MVHAHLPVSSHTPSTCASPWPASVSFVITRVCMPGVPSTGILTFFGVVLPVLVVPKILLSTLISIWLEPVPGTFDKAIVTVRAPWKVSSIEEAAHESVCGNIAFVFAKRPLKVKFCPKACETQRLKRADLTNGQILLRWDSKRIAIVSHYICLC